MATIDRSDFSKSSDESYPIQSNPIQSVVWNAIQVLMRQQRREVEWEGLGGLNTREGVKVKVLREKMRGEREGGVGKWVRCSDPIRSFFKILKKEFFPRRKSNVSSLWDALREGRGACLCRNSTSSPYISHNSNSDPLIKERSLVVRCAHLIIYLLLLLYSTLFCI